MIEKLEIFNYRSCMHTTINLQPDLTVLIGPNGSGKTNILNACLLLRGMTDDAPMWGHEEDEDTATESRLKTTFRHGDKKAILTSNVMIHTDEHNRDVIQGSGQSWYVHDFTDSMKRLKAPLWLTNHHNRIRYFPHGYKPNFRVPSFPKNWQIPDSFRVTFSAIGDFLTDIKYYSASQFTNPSLCPVSFEVEQEGRRRMGVKLQGHSRFLYDLYDARGTSGYDHFFNVIGPDGIGLVNDIKFQEITTSSIDYTVRSGGAFKTRTKEKKLIIPQFYIGDNVLSPSQLSEGTFKTITLLFYVMTEKSSSLLIEEPEVCVHHGLLTSIIELIKQYSKQKQIIVSTHSDFVLDQIEPRHVYKVSRTPEEGTKISQIAKEMSAMELEALKIYLDTEGNLGEYWRNGGFD